MKRLIPLFVTLMYFTSATNAQNFTIDMSQTHQTIDGFGAHQGDDQVNQAWWQSLYFNGLGSSIYRLDLTPRLITPYSDLSYYSPWFMGSQIDSEFNLEDPDNPDGPENNRVRTYTGPNDYSKLFGGKNAPICIMGPDIEENVLNFVYGQDDAIEFGNNNKASLGDFKVIGSLWSPVPWVKTASGNQWDQSWWPGPVAGSKWPFIWGGNFAGGKLDVSDTKLEVFNDSSLGGSGPTSALTQFARSTAAYIKGYQAHFNMKFYAISIQNELNFEQFYNSATYPLSSQYIKAVIAVKDEFAKHISLKDIKIIGPEDLLGSDTYGLWEYGSSQGPIHKNLQYIQNIEADPEAAQAVDFYCIHGYDANGVSSSGSNSINWERWANGWTSSPAPGLPENVKGFNGYGKKSWMTETSGEADAWLSPATGFPGNGGWSIALKIHQALVEGNQSAWVYWTFSGDVGSNTSGEFSLTTEAQGINAPKFVGARHFFKYIRPNSIRTDVSKSGSGGIVMSAYKNLKDSTYTFVLINSSPTSQIAHIQLLNQEFNTPVLNLFTSENNKYWLESQTQMMNTSSDINVPGYGVVTCTAKALITTSSNSPIVKDTKLTCYPNPATSFTSLSLESSVNTEIELKILSPLGVLLKSYNTQLLANSNFDYQLDTKSFSPGIYTIVLKTNFNTEIKKLVIVH